jgi:threonine dehydrogenase-like Zn-dependent dehydrogenase
MKTLVVDKTGELQVTEVSMPKYNDYQALVKTLSCGVCNGTDAKLIHRAFKGFDLDRYPLMLGHEAVGRVVEVGAKVTGLQTGDLVLLPFNDPIDGFDSAWGAYSEYGVVNDPSALAANLPYQADLFGCANGQTKLPSDIDPVDAAMIITLREVLSSIKRFGLRENDSIAVFGCGPVGLTFIKFLHLLGVKPIFAFDIVDTKLAEARKMGADYTFDSRSENLVEKVRSVCPNGVRYVLDAVGITAIINQAMPLLADQGKICCYGISPNQKAEIDWSLAPYNWQLQFQQFPSKQEEFEAHNQVMAWIKAGIIDLKDFISDVIPFEDILTAFDKLDKRQIQKKCIIRYE